MILRFNSTDMWKVAATAIFYSIAVILLESCTATVGIKESVLPNAQMLLFQFPLPEKTAEEEAKRALNDLKTIVNGNNFRLFGFDSPEQAQTAEIAEPLSVIYIGVDQLRAFSGLKSVNDLKTAGGEFLFPVMAGGQPMLSIRVVRKDGNWSVAEMGNPLRLRQIYSSMDSFSLSQNRKNTEFTLVRIPGIEMDFMSRSADGVLSDTSRVLPLPSDFKSARGAYSSNHNSSKEIIEAPASMILDPRVKRAKTTFLQLAQKIKSQNLE